jgi:hypothetical protein
MIPSDITIQIIPDIVNIQTPSSGVINIQTSEFPIGYGLFYPINNPSGFITGVDGTNLYPKSSGNFLEQQILEIQSDYYPRNNPSGFIANFNSGDYTLKTTFSESGAFWQSGLDSLKQNTGNYYPNNNPSGFIREFNSGIFVLNSNTGILVGREEFLRTGSYLSGEIVALNLISGNFYSKTNPSGYITGIDTSNFYLKSNFSGDLNQFYPKSNPSGFITGFNSGDYLLKSDTGIFAKASDLALTGETLISHFYPLNNPSGYITGVDLSNYYLKSNPSGYITGLDLSSYLLKTQTGAFLDLNIFNQSGAAWTLELNTLSSATGDYLQKSETGLFFLNTSGSQLNQSISALESSLNNYYPLSNPSGFISGDLSKFLTRIPDNLVTADFADSRYFGLQSGISISGKVVTLESNQTNFYPNSNPSGFITGVDTSNFLEKNGNGSGITGLTKTQVGLGNVINLDTTTTANISDSLNKRFVTDIQSVVLGNTSGINLGDLTLGTNRNGLSLSDQTLSLGVASSGTTGALTSTDWNIFNNKQNSLGFTPANSTITIIGISGLTGGGYLTSNRSIFLDLNSANSWNGQQILNATNASTVGVIVKGYTSQSSDLQQWQRSDGTVPIKVDASGNLIQQTILANETGAQTLGTELLSSTGWTSTGWTGSFAAGWTHTVGNTTSLTNTLASVSGNRYRITLTITNRTAGTLSVTFGGVLSASAISSTVVVDTRVVSGTLSVGTSTDFDGTVVVSVKQITGSLAPTFLINDSTAAPTLEFRPTTASLFNQYLGVNAGRYSTSAYQNTIFGYNAFANSQMGYQNVAIGYNALTACNTSYQNVAVGNAAMAAQTVGSSNIAVGFQALTASSAGNGNTALGSNSLRNTTNSNNTAVGSNSLYNNVGGGGSVAIGNQALYNSATGSNNVALGSYAGKYWDGSSKVFIDGLDRTNKTNELASALIVGTLNASVTGQSLSFNAATIIAPSGSLGVGIAIPTSTLHVNGSLTLSYIAKTADYTLGASDYLVNCTANSFNITLPTAVGITGRVYKIKNSGAGTITILTTSSQTIDGQASAYWTITTKNSMELMSDGANWIIT